MTVATEEANAVKLVWMYGWISVINILKFISFYVSFLKYNIIKSEGINSIQLCFNVRLFKLRSLSVIHL